jgi:hypothetical protein
MYTFIGKTFILNPIDFAENKGDNKINLTFEYEIF